MIQLSKGGGFSGGEFTDENVGPVASSELVSATTTEICKPLSGGHSIKASSGVQRKF